MTVAAWLKNTLHRVEVRYGLQTFLGFFCFLAMLSPPAVWNALSLEEANISPVYAAVAFMVCLQPNVGTAIMFVAQRLTGAVVGGALGVAATYIAYGANGSTYKQSSTKGAVMVIVISIFGFFLSLLRFHYPKWTFGFTVATISMPIVALSGYHLDYVENKIILFWCIETFIAVVSVGLISTLILPNTAGAAVRTSIHSSLGLLGRGTVELMDIMFSAAESQRLDVGGQGQELTESSQYQATANIAVLSGLGDTRKNMSSSVPLGGSSSTSNPRSIGVAMESFMAAYPQPVSAALIKSRANLESTKTEISIYHRPHIFPKAGYDVLMSLLRQYLSTLMTLAYILNSGGEGAAPLGATKELRNHILPVVEGIQSTLVSLANCLVKKKGKSPGSEYVAALDHLAQLEQALKALGHVHLDVLLPNAAMMARTPSTATALRDSSRKPETTTYEESEVLLADTVLVVVFALGSFARRACFVLPDVLRHDTATRKAWRDHFKGSVWDIEGIGASTTNYIHPALQDMACDAPKSPLGLQCLGSLVSSLSSETNLQAIVTDPSGRGGSGGANSPFASQRAISQGYCVEEEEGQGRPFPSSPAPVAVVSDRLDSTTPAPPTPARRTKEATRWIERLKERVRQRTGFSWEEFSMAVQLAVTLAIACTLHVCDATYNALDKKTIWIVMTVVVLMQHSIGGFLLKGANRFVGTFVAGGAGLAVLYLVYAINGLSYSNNFLKFGAMCVLLPLVQGIYAWAHLLSPPLWGYGYVVVKLTTPIIVLPGYSGEILSNTSALWRLCCVAIGIALELIVGSCVLPVTTRDAVKRRVRDTLDALADLTAMTSMQLLGTDDSTSASNQHDEGNGGPPPTPPPSSAAAAARESPDIESAVSVLPTAAPSQTAGGEGVDRENTAISQITTAIEMVSPPPQEPPHERQTPPSFPGLPPVRTAPPRPQPPLRSQTSPESPASPTSASSAEFFSEETPKGRKLKKKRTKWLRRAAHGAPVMQIRPLGVEAAQKVLMLHESADVVAFETRVLPSWARSIRTEDMVTMRRALRHLLNALMSFSYVLYGPDVPHLRLLIPFRDRLDAIAGHMSECLRAVGEVVSGGIPLGGTVPMQVALRAQVHALLEVVESSPPPPMCSEADAILGFASLGVLVAVVQTMEEVRQAVDRLLSDTALCANPAPATIEIGTEQQQQQQGSGDFDWGGSSLQGTKMNRGDIAAAAAAGNTEKTGEEEEEDSMRHMIDGF